MSQKIVKISTEPASSDNSDKVGSSLAGPLKIYKPQDLVFISDAKKYYEDTLAQCQKMVEEAQKKCQDMEDTHYKNILQKVHEENQKIWEDSSKKCDAFLQNVEKEIQDVLKGVIHKLYFDTSLTSKVFPLLSAEIDKIQSRVKLITVYANPNAIHILRSRILEDHQGCRAILEFQVREELIDEECIVETEYGITRLNVENFMNSLFP
jgi:vacuolar-type H+-ATPase subunit E/Vma4